MNLNIKNSRPNSKRPNLFVYEKILGPCPIGLAWLIFMHENLGPNVIGPMAKVWS
jgi:hypothetical protein